MNKDGFLLITGVSGFVGEHLARHFAAKGMAVAGTYLTHAIHLEGVATFPLDATDRPAVRRMVRDMRPWGIVHCAAETNTAWCQSQPTEARAAIVEATENISMALKELAPETPLVGFSTDLVFDGENAPYEEEAEAKPLNIYGGLKREAEEHVRRLPRGIVLRSALVYGPPATHKASFLGWMLESMLKKGEVTLFEDEWRTAVFVDDLAAAVELLLEVSPKTGEGNIFHAGGPDRLNRLEMGRMMCEVFELPEELLRGARRADVPGAENRARDVSLQCDRLRKLNWNPTTFRNGLKACKQRWITQKNS